MKKIDKGKFNAYIIALYMFQFGFLQPVAIIVDSQWPVAAFTIILVLLMLLNNGFKTKLYVLLSFTLLSIYFLFNACIYMESSLTILLLFAEFILKSFSAFMVGSLDINSDELYNSFLKIAVINFIILGVFPFTGLINSIGYMRYGYAMTPSVIMFFYAYLKNKDLRFLWMPAVLMAFTLTVLYGSRGPVIVFLLVLFLAFIFNSNLSKYRKIGVLAFSGSAIFLINKYSLMLKLFRYIFYNIKIQTYSVEKFIMMIEVGITKSSSGREELYYTLMEYIKEKPIFGNGIGFSQQALGITPHNIFLQVLLEAGITGLFLCIILTACFVYEYKILSMDNKDGFYKIVTLVISVSLGRLMVSSDLWLRPELWLAVSLLINNRKTILFRKRYV